MITILNIVVSHGRSYNSQASEKENKQSNHSRSRIRIVNWLKWFKIFTSIGFRTLCPATRPVVTREPFPGDFKITLDKNYRNNFTVHFISYATDKFKESRLRISSQAKEFGLFKTINVLSPTNLSDDFRKRYRSILELPRGAGYWIWKPWVILQTLQNINDGEYVLYLDCGSTIRVGDRYRKRMLKYFHMLNQSKEAVLCGDVPPYKEKMFDSEKVLDAFGIRHKAEILESWQIWAGFIIVKRQKSVLQQFQKIFRLLEVDPWIITDNYGKESTLPDFIVNRHDQSLLGLLFKCHGVILVNLTDGEVPVKGTRIRKR